MGRLPAMLLICGWAAVSQLGPARAEQYESDKLTQSAQQGDDPAELVRKLGDRSFSVRRRSTARLIALGAESIQALERGVQSPDREIRYRSKHALKIVREGDFQRRLRAFASGRDIAEDYHLPGWTRFAKEVGVGPAARTLFVEMQQAEPELLAAVEENPDDLGQVLANRIAELQARMALGRESDQPTLGTITSILFVLNGNEVELPTVLMQSIGSYFRYPAFDTAIQTGSQRELLRKMLGTWIVQSKGWDAYHAMFLAMRYNLPIGLAPAKRVLEGELAQQNQTYFLGYALLTFAKFGDPSHYSLIEPLLDDETPYGGTIAVGGKAKFRTQIRDIALASLVKIADLNHKDFGFTRFRTHSALVFNTSSLAFEDDEKRAESILKWSEFRKSKSK